MSSQIPREDLITLIDCVNAATKAVDTPGVHAASNCRRYLLLECKRRIAALEDPDAEVWPRAFQVNVAVSIDIAATLGVWEKLRTEKSIALAEVVKDTGADVAATVRVMRQLTAAGLLSDISDPREPSYSLEYLGKPYLDPNHVSFNRFILQEVVPTVRSSVERSCLPSTNSDGLPQDTWCRLAQDAVRAADMVRGMKSLSSGGLAATAYPFDRELGKLDIKEGDVAIVDVAGGQGHIMGDVRKQNPELKGRIVVQDLQSVLDAAPDGPPEGVEFMAHDIFKPQPITTAHVYYLRHIVHDWDDDSVTVILNHLTLIMKARPRTKLLLADLVLPTTDIGMQEAVRDFTMFRIGGLERTEVQWRQLLVRSGLGVKRIWRGTEPEACIECILISGDGDGEAMLESRFITN
ncbi:hypothetical protein LA080_012848 [Diaporthe eres]|nr:hypothetical protein LA080_012848 [Diaporthe eres]